MTQNSHPQVLAALVQHLPLSMAVSGQIRPDKAEAKDTYPLVVMRRSGYRKERHLDGSTSAEWEEFEVECWGQTRADSLAVMALVMEALEAAGFEPEEGESDGIDPQFLDLVNVLKVEIWTT